MVKKLLIVLITIGVIGTLINIRPKVTPIQAGNICGGCGSCDDDTGCCCGGATCNTGCINCGACSSSSSSSSGCSNSVTCQGLTNDQTYDCAKASLSGGSWGQTMMPSNTCYKRIGQYANGTNSCAPKWPSWSNISGQDDIVWHDKTGVAAPWSPYAAYYYSDIPMSSHPISWQDSLMFTHVYFNSNATFCGAIGYYKCYGAFSIASGSYTFGTGQHPRYSTMSVTGTGVYYESIAVGGDGEVIVGICN